MKTILKLTLMAAITVLTLNALATDKSSEFITGEKMAEEAKYFLAHMSEDGTFRGELSKTGEDCTVAVEPSEKGQNQIVVKGQFGLRMAVSLEEKQKVLKLEVSDDNGTFEDTYLFGNYVKYKLAFSWDEDAFQKVRFSNGKTSLECILYF